MNNEAQKRAARKYQQKCLHISLYLNDDEKELLLFARQKSGWHNKATIIQALIDYVK